MKKLLLLLVLAFGVSTFAQAQAQAPVPANSIAVMELKAGVGVNQTDVDGLSAIFTTYFSPDGYDLRERTVIDKAIAEKQFQKSTLTENQSREVGAFLKVHKIVIGNVNIIMGEYNVDVRVIEVGTGNIVGKSGITFNSSSYRASMQTLATDLAKQIAIRPIITSNNFVETTAGLNMKMIWVDGGEFQMGATGELKEGAYDDEYPVHTVKLSSFYIGECEVTQAQWEKVMGTTIQQQASKAGYPTRGVGPDYPMYYVSWEEAQAFCRELSRMTGRTYCLPTEAQWEYAARGGKKADGTKYSGSWQIDAAAWYKDNSGNTTHPVKKKRANGLGLYDMSGNVWEWCSDWYNKNYYSSSPANNPTGPSSGSTRVLRGGSWGSNASGCRVSNRNSSYPSHRDSSYGFRVVVLP